MYLPNPFPAELNKAPNKVSSFWVLFTPAQLVSSFSKSKAQVRALKLMLAQLIACLSSSQFPVFATKIANFSQLSTHLLGIVYLIFKSGKKLAVTLSYVHWTLTIKWSVLMNIDKLTIAARMPIWEGDKTKIVIICFRRK